MLIKRKTYSIQFLLAVTICLVAGCDFIKMKQSQALQDSKRQPVARVKDKFLYRDELVGFVPAGTNPQDSIARVTAYVNSWIRKQLLIDESTRKINIDEASVERKVLDYRYSIIAYEYQTHYIKEHLDTNVSIEEIQAYYNDNLDNFILKQNIVQATFIKVPKSAPRTEKIKELMYSTRDKDVRELKSYCLSFSVAYHIADSAWMVFDELVKNSPLAEIPNKIQFLKTNPYYETSDDGYLYFLKVNQYRISDNISPLEFVKEDIRNIVLNKRKVALAKQLEEDVYNNAANRNEFEIFN
jgi:hypothetical protein